MSFSVSADRWPAPALRGHYRPGLPPEVLREAGILTNPADPAQALRRARLLMRQGYFREARSLLCPHERHALGNQRLQVGELLARCAMAVGGDWEQLLSATLDGYVEAGDLTSAGRMHRNLGEMMLSVGRLGEADRQLSDARALFMRFNEPVRAAMVECLRARVRLRAGFVKAAHERVETAIAVLEPLAAPRPLALARLVRARVLASRCEAGAAARDLVAAERVLGASGKGVDRIRSKLVRAECLILLGEPLRAANGLRRLLVDIVDLEETSTRAWVHSLMGEALLEADAVGARRHLMRARHLYGALSFAYPIARCDMALARVELRMGLNATSRLRGLDRAALAEWPILVAHLQIALAEIGAAKDAERARERLFTARGFALESGDRSLLHEVDRVLRRSGLFADGSDTPVDPDSARVVVQVGSTRGLRPRFAAERAPEPMLLTEAHEPAHVFPMSAAVKLVQRGAPAHADLMLRPPRRVGAQT